MTTTTERTSSTDRSTVTNPAPRWCIRVTRRAAFKGGDPGDWRNYRDFMVWPKTFPSQSEAQEFMDSCFTFKGLTGRKLSASACLCNVGPSKHKGHQ